MTGTFRSASCTPANTCHAISGVPIHPPPSTSTRKATGAEPGQGDVYGHLHIPKDYTATAFAVDRALAALERMKDGPFSLTCSIEAPHPPQLNVDPYWGMYPPVEMPLPKNHLHDMSDSPYRAATARMQRYRMPANVRDITSIYYGVVKEVDDNIGRLQPRRSPIVGVAELHHKLPAGRADRKLTHGLSRKTGRSPITATSVYRYPRGMFSRSMNCEIMPTPGHGR